MGGPPTCGGGGGNCWGYGKCGCGPPGGYPGGAVMYGYGGIVTGGIEEDEEDDDDDPDCSMSVSNILGVWSVRKN